ncbi:MAG: sugar-binding protein [Cytophagaceae bacterium]
MKIVKAPYLVILMLLLAESLNAQTLVGFYDAPYTRYEADLGTLNNASITAKSYDQSLVQSEASDQICVNMTSANASVAWTVSAAGDGLVVRYSIPDGSSGSIDVYNGATFLLTLNLTTTWSWEYLMGNPNPNDAGVTNPNPKMRFDEVRAKLPSQIPAGGTLKLVWKSGTISLDFAELEPVPAAVTASGSDVTYDGSGLQTFITNHGGQTIYLPAGTYNIGTTLYFGNNNTTLKGAGSWYTEIHFTNTTTNNGGLWGQASGISYSGLYLTTVGNSRSNNSKALNGVYTSTSTITDVWAIHFECGAWIAQFGTGPSVADGFKMSYCRFRNNYADGTNLSKGTINAIVEHCSYRNNGDDDMAIWPANNQSCDNNTFRYNTAENSWRASGCAIYGGFNNQAHHLLIKDNLEAGLRANNSFAGSPFSGSGTNLFSNIKIISGGTNRDLFDNPIGAIDLLATNVTSGGNVINVKFSCIEIIDAKNDAIYINKTTGNGYTNLAFENITINGTGKEYPANAGNNAGSRGYMVLIKGNPSGNATYCGMNYSNRGGTAGQDVVTSGTMSWGAAGSCPAGCSALVTSLATSSTTITSSSTFWACDNPITLSATNTAPGGITASSVQFFVDGVSKGTDNTSPYSAIWSTPTIGTHSVYAVTTYSNGSTSTSPTQTLTVGNEIYSTATAPTIDGTAEGLWNNFASISLNAVKAGAANISGSADLSASFKVTRDGTYLYVLIDVNDNTLRNDGPANWQKDNVELYIDYGNNKLPCCTYGPNDEAYNFTWNVNTVNVGPGSSTGVTFAQTTKAGNAGYIMEVRLPWSTLGGVPAPGDLLGFEVEVNDSDAGPDRDSKIAWTPAATDDAWENPSQFGTLQIAGCNNPLPVEFLTFAGAMKNETVVLSWSTASEKSNEKFVIERSNDLSAWQAIGEVAGAGNSGSVIEYNFTDYAPLAGQGYYRLKQVDLNGMFSSSNVIVVQGDKQSVSIMPNPFEDALTVKRSGKVAVNISIHDLLGRLVYQTVNDDGNPEFLIHPDLAGGTYIISIQTQYSVEQRKIIRK